MYKGFVPTWVRLGPWNIIVSLTRRKKNIAQFPLLMLTSQEIIIPPANKVWGGI